MNTLKCVLLSKSTFYCYSEQKRRLQPATWKMCVSNLNIGQELVEGWGGGGRGGCLTSWLSDCRSQSPARRCSVSRGRRVGWGTGALRRWAGTLCSRAAGCCCSSRFGSRCLCHPRHCLDHHLSREWGKVVEQSGSQGQASADQTPCF